MFIYVEFSACNFLGNLDRIARDQKDYFRWNKKIARGKGRGRKTRMRTGDGEGRGE
jgi:hypothetical protein